MNPGCGTLPGFVKQGLQVGGTFQRLDWTHPSVHGFQGWFFRGLARRGGRAISTAPIFRPWRRLMTEPCLLREAMLFQQSIEVEQRIEL